jgi:hypothetical protein
MVIVLLAGFAKIAPNLAEQERPAARDTVYVSPAGSGNRCSFEAPCSLAGARDRVRSVNENMRNDIIVYLRGGTYVLSSPLELTGQDSGSAGHNVVYRAYKDEKPVISGGTKVSGWSLHDRAKNIYQAYVGKSLQTRQLYVDGVRAIRARSEDYPSGFSKTSTGYTTTNTAMKNWGNVDDLEFVDNVQWLSYRCGVSSVSGNTITMKEPCWSNTQRNSRPEEMRMGSPTWIENAYELLDAPGEWYLDRSTGFLYYKPRDNENLSTATVTVPTLETLVEGNGTLDDPVQHIHFYGITFSDATWLGPNTDEGYASSQAGFRYIGPADSGQQEKPPASVSFSAAKHVRLERNIFENMGAAGLSFEHGSQDNTVIGNVFRDISGGGVYVGDIDDHHPSDERAIVENNLIKNNYVSRTGLEYFDQLGIWAGYTDGSVIEHNELHDLPYGAISVGWGWGCVDPGGDCSWTDGFDTPTVSMNNRVKHNLVYDYMKVLNDGGGIYTLGSQPNSEISDNYLHDQRGNYAPLYLDEGTQHYIVENNVVASAPEWLHLWTNSIKNNIVQHNFTYVHSITNDAPDNVVRANVMLAPDDWSEEACDIMASAGIETAYQNIK